MSGQEHTRSVDLVTAIVGLVRRHGEARAMEASMRAIGSASARSYQEQASDLLTRIERTLTSAVNATQADIRTPNRGPLPGWPDPDARPRY